MRGGAVQAARAAAAVDAGHAVAIGCDCGPALYGVRTVRRLRIDGRLVPLGTVLRSDSLRLVASMVLQGDARALDAATARDVDLFALLRRATADGGRPDAAGA